MHPSASLLMTVIGGGGCPLAPAALLLSLCLGLPSSVSSCSSSCLCASDIISCSGRYLSALPSDVPSYATRLDLSHNAITVLPVDWISQPLGRLVSLVLSRNDISEIEVNVFTLTPRLHHLDLSSNRLTTLNSSIFTGLKELKELLLFGNQIAQINPGAFSDLHSLQRLYLSGNRLVAFPLGLYWEPGGPYNLSFLDVSYNRLPKVPIQSLLSLSQHGEIYVQENPLVCDCAFLALLQYWMWKQYRPLVDFIGGYPCGGDSGLGSECRPEVAPDVSLEEQTYQIEPGRWLRLSCPGLVSAATTSPVVFWVTPRTVVNSSTDDPNSHLVVFPNGTLDIQSALLEDSGVYMCVTARRHKYDPSDFLEVRVTVGNLSTTSTNGLARRSSAEHFNTAFTTLASCVVSIILVLLYLYLTPCRCRESRSGGSRGCGGRAIIVCSDPREVESGHRRSNGKRVAFLEPQVEDCVTGVPKTPGVNFGHAATEGILKNGSRTVGQSLADPANIA
ncbi:amphoterin-induced protein 2-like [Antennarius striatus]|uniref:amphoterin-induced protein 2-like n=1 Tax=Antennarius striatus TaxID=241820 RepID=UPI0035B3BD3D